MVLLKALNALGYPFVFKLEDFFRYKYEFTRCKRYFSLNIMNK